MTTTPKPDYEQQKIDFEKEKFQAEASARERELSIKERELTLKEQELNKDKSKLSPTNVTIIVALLGIFGTVIANLVQNISNTGLERQKLQSELILKAMASQDFQQNKNSLRFMLKAGMLSDYEDKIKEIPNDKSDSSDISFNTNPPKHIHFKILDGLKQPIVGARVDVQYGRIKATKTTDGNGEFESEVIANPARNSPYLSITVFNLLGSKIFEKVYIPDDYYNMEKEVLSPNLDIKP
jgi:hypothetical protein